MIPIVKHPMVFKKYAPFFREMFSKPQYKHFQKFLTGIIVSNNHYSNGNE